MAYYHVVPCAFVSKMADASLLCALKRNPRLLKLSFKRLHYLPAIIGNCTAVEEIDAKGNYISELPDEFALLKKLVRINLSNNRFETIPPQLLAISGLRTLHLFGNSITAICSQFFVNLSHLVLLNLNDNEIDDIPPAINKLSCLEYLSVDRNRLSRIPEELCELDSLKELHCADNKLESLPTNVGCLKSLKKLFCQKNLLMDLPETICDCASLVVLDISANQIRIFPQRFLHLNIKELYCEGNNLYSCAPVKAVQQDEVLSLKEITARFILSHEELLSRLHQLPSPGNALLSDYGLCDVCSAPYLNTWLDCVEFISYKKHHTSGGVQKMPVEGRICSYSCFNSNGHSFYGIAAS